MDIEVVRNELTRWREVDAGDDTVWGRVPVWGFAEVVETWLPEVASGNRLFGSLPMSTELVIVPGNATRADVVDLPEHRSVIAGPYNGYRRCAADPVYRPGTEEIQMLLYPLFFTSFVIDDFVADHGDFGAEQVVVSSASAKTALGAAHLLLARGVRTVGLTSLGNADFCRLLGVYDRVATYDAVDTLDRVQSVFIDVSGDQGADVLVATMAEAWGHYAEWVSNWLTLEHAVGTEAVIEVFRTYLAGRVDPRVGTVCTLQTEEVSA